MDPKEFANVRIEVAQALEKTHGFIKVNLIHEGGPIKSEGIWAVPLSPSDAEKLRDDASRGEPVRVYLANMPLWNDRCWGAEVICVTRGDERAEARIADQAELDEEVALLFQGLAIIDEENNPGEKRA